VPGPRLLLFAATTGYQIRSFAESARRLGVSLTLASDRCHVLEDPWGDGARAVKFDRIPESVEALLGERFDGIAAVGDRPAVLAAAAAQMLGVPFHPLAAAQAANDKHLARQLYRAARLRVPAFFRVSCEEDSRSLAARAPYPCVLKPLGLSASRGVIRANDETEFEAAFRRIKKMGERHLQVETYIEGREFAIEGLVTRGRFQALAVFDKPDPLEGPFFEETIYVTPSREAATVQRELLAATEGAVAALGLCHGPVHAELRYNSEGAWILEVAARPIGGLCARALRFAPAAANRPAGAFRGASPAAGQAACPSEIPLEELILRHALGEDVTAARLAGPASGVMMIPIPKAGVYESAGGMEGALAVDHIEDVVITAKTGQQLVPLPEGASYLGFIFARADTAAEVESALRKSHANLEFGIATALETFRP
jgi:ATP-grasp domain/L-amino acid ligase C-terminal domain 2